MRTIGLIVNPYAGLGGSVGLKGSDGMAVEAMKRGAVKKAGARAGEALKELLPLKEEFLILCPTGEMGEDLCRSMGFRYEIAGDDLPGSAISPGTSADHMTTAADTIRAAAAMKDADLLLFAGGDGTARDIVTSGFPGPVIGIPAGVKIHSPVYAVRPRAAGALAAAFIRGERTRLKEAEVVDINETAYREGRVSTSLFGYLKIPESADFMQHGKASSPASELAQQQSIAAEMISRMTEGTCYLVGPGTTTRTLMEELNLPDTLLGVDLIRDKKLVSADLCEQDILSLLAESSSNVCLIITPTGGQGYLLGRGNQQISGRVIQRLGKDNIYILATRDKLFNLQGRPLLVDTGDTEADKLLSGYRRAIIGWQEEQMVRIEG